MKTIRSPRLFVGTAVLAGLLAACTTVIGEPVATSPGGTPAATANAGAASTSSVGPSPGTSSLSPGSPAPEPTTDLAPFECALPASLPGTGHAQIVDVRVGSHGAGASGYDRIVIEFEGSGLPAVTLRAGTPPFTRDPSDLPLPVRGASFLVLVLQGATAVAPDGTTTYGGPTGFAPDFAALTEFKEAGDFESVTEWVAGLTGPSCHRLFVLSNPTRLVIDVQHPQG